VCEFEVDDPASASGQDTRKARKEHECDECGTTIKKGDAYVRYWWKDDDFNSAKNCKDCEKALQLFRDEHQGFWFPAGLMGEEYRNCALHSETFAELMKWGRIWVAYKRRAQT
jgi:hypothetical protein